MTPEILSKKSLALVLTMGSTLHECIASELKAAFYFAHPGFSWERGLHENTNGLVRQYFPTYCRFTTITQQDVDEVAHTLNHC